jgi:hypothetical protein
VRVQIPLSPPTSMYILPTFWRRQKLRAECGVLSARSAPERAGSRRNRPIRRAFSPCEVITVRLNSLEAFGAAFAQASPLQGTAQNFRYSTRWVIFFSGRRSRRACFAKAMRSMDGSILGNPTSHILDPMLSINSGYLWAVIKYFHESCVSSNNPGLHCRIFC